MDTRLRFVNTWNFVTTPSDLEQWAPELSQYVWIWFMWVTSCGRISRTLHAMDMRLAPLDTPKTEVCKFMWKCCDNPIRFGAMSPELDQYVWIWLMWVTSCCHISWILWPMDMRLAPLDTTKTEVCKYMWKYYVFFSRTSGCTACKSLLCIKFFIFNSSYCCCWYNDLLPYIDINAKNKEGASPLHLAAQLNKEMVIETLLEEWVVQWIWMWDCCLQTLYTRPAQARYHPQYINLLHCTQCILFLLRAYMDSLCVRV